MKFLLLFEQCLHSGKFTVKSLTYCERIFCSLEKHTSSSFESPCFYSLVYFSGGNNAHLPSNVKGRRVSEIQVALPEERGLGFWQQKSEIFLKPEPDK